MRLLRYTAKESKLYVSSDSRHSTKYSPVFLVPHCVQQQQVRVWKILGKASKDN